jgi:hypothetical protein
MQNGRRKALKSFVLHIRVRIGLRPQPAWSAGSIPRLASRYKLPLYAQFQDRPGACKLIETAVSRGDQTMAQRLADCRAK